ncbi:restriction endonuclease subunit S [Actinoalloteichus fjordicus]|uniref:Restriction endonuclease S subunit n=1 Tax=Actinoalloteichus fjordicus TaxID=1612552 RepID=A0AAC9LF96_9PSEU|nr:restriction endonuclease subunit S [Actinoalloteichus fjordicus]APU15235.1 restriction endonuclease S subunit [Actinoalloteichus fjordicus]
MSEQSLWPSKALSKIGELIRGRRFTKNDYVESGLGCIHYAQIHTDFAAIAKNSLTFLAENSRARMRLARPGDLVIAATSENVDDVGKAVAWLGDDDVAVHDDCYIFRHRLDPVYVSYFFTSSPFNSQKIKYVSETKVARISGVNLGLIEIPVPPRQVQERIVEVIGAVDEQIAALGAEVASLRSLLAGTRRELESVEDRTALVDLAEPRGIQIGPFGSQLHAHEYTEDSSGTPVVMPQDLVDGQILTTKIRRVPDNVAARLSRHRLTAGDIVFPRRGDLSKRALVIAEQDGWLCGTGCIRVRPQDSSMSRLLAEALSGAATTEWLVSHAVGTTMLNLNTEILSNLPVADIKGHHAIAEACLEIVDVIRRTQLQASRLRSVRASLLSGLLNRTIDIKSAELEV